MQEVRPQFNFCAIFWWQHAIGWIPLMLPFGLADPFTSTLDIPTVYHTFRVTGREVLSNLWIGKVWRGSILLTMSTRRAEQELVPQVSGTDWAFWCSLNPKLLRTVALILSPRFSARHHAFHPDILILIRLATDPVYGMFTSLAYKFLRFPLRVQPRAIITSNEFGSSRFLPWRVGNERRFLVGSPASACNKMVTPN